MRNIHFFKARSRLGLINPPYRQTDMNVGVEDGPDAILSPDFLAQFNNPSLHHYTFPKPEDINRNEYQNVIAKSSLECANLILSHLMEDETRVTIGGDHSITFASLLALQERINLDTVGYIQIDSHADIHLFSTSPTGNFHGIYVRPFVDKLDSKHLNSLVKTRLLPRNMLYIGNLDLENEEKRFIEGKAILTYSRSDIMDKGDKVRKSLQDIMKRTSRIHVSFDMDVFDQMEVPATGIPARGGIFLADIIPYLGVLACAHSLSVDLVEINPRKSGAKKSIEIARKVLLELLP